MHVALGAIRRARVHVNAVREIIEEHVVHDELGAAHVVDVRAVVEVLVRAVVVHDVAVLLGIHRLIPERDALLSRVVNHEVDELLPRATRFHRRQTPARRRPHDLEAPKCHVRTVRAQRTIDGRALTRILTEHDRTALRAGDRRAEVARIGSGAHPDRIAGLYLA